ncbi:hypothetical protein ACLOJK_012196 [Asimina triloba]
MAGFALRKLASLMVLCVVAAPYSEAAMTCGTVGSAITPCFGYLTKKGPLVTKCCSGVVSLNNAAKSTQDRQTACSCLQKAAKGMDGLDLGRAAGLPAKCGVSIPYKISPDTDCSK